MTGSTEKFGTTRLSQIAPSRLIYVRIGSENLAFGFSPRTRKPHVHVTRAALTLYAGHIEGEFAQTGSTFGRHVLREITSGKRWYAALTAILCWWQMSTSRELSEFPQLSFAAVRSMKWPNSANATSH